MIALVLVSHSTALAQGLTDLAAQMAPDVAFYQAAGTLEGELGTSIDLVQHAVEQALATSDGVVVLADLGSAVFTVEMAIDLAEEWSGRVQLAVAPFVEGAVVAAVAAQQGGDLAAVVAAAASAGKAFGTLTDDDGGPAPELAPRPPVAIPDPLDLGSPAETVVAEEFFTAHATLRNPLGLHARPAAQLARAVADLGASVTIDGVDGSSVLQLLALGATGGRELEIAARGSGARAAVEAVAGMIEGGFGEA